MTEEREDMMFWVTAILMLILLVWIFILASTCDAQCGSARWSSKILTDGAKLETSIEPMTIGELNSLKRPSGKWNTLIRSGWEAKLVTVTGNIIAIGEERDKDLHIVLSDGHNSIICEVPSPGDCTEVAASLYADKFTAVRKWALVYIGNFHHSIKKLKQPVSATIKGYIFFDKPHGQKDAAINNCEIHSIIGIE